MSENFAVYFDCENVSATFVAGVLERLESKGKRLLIKRAFRDWGKQSDWTQALAEQHGIEPVQVFAKGLKNGADIAITINVMKELRNGVLQGVALVSSDSDFSHLATEIRANGLEVFIFGDSEKANERLKNSCDKFFPFPKAPQKPAAKPSEPLQKSAQKASEKSAQNSTQKANKNPPKPKKTSPAPTPKNAKPATKSEKEIKEILAKILKTLKANADKNGFCNTALLNNHLKSRKLSLADFGAKRWKTLLNRFPEAFEYKIAENKGTLMIRLK